MAGGFAPALRAGFVIAAVEGEGLLLTRGAGITVPAQGRGAALGDGADGAPLRRSQGGPCFEILGQEAAQDPDDTGSHAARPLARQALGQSLHQDAAVLVAAMGEMQIDHGGVDLLVAEQGLHGVQARSGFEQVCREAVAQGVDGGVGQAEFLAGDNDEALEGTQRHRAGGPVHALGQLVRRARAASGVWERCRTGWRWKAQ